MNSLPDNLVSLAQVLQILRPKNNFESNFVVAQTLQLVELQDRLDYLFLHQNKWILVFRDLLVFELNLLTTGDRLTQFGSHYLLLWHISETVDHICFLSFLCVPLRTSSSGSFYFSRKFWIFDCQACFLKLNLLHLVVFLADIRQVV